VIISCGMSFAFSLVVDLTLVERRLARLQAQLIWYRGSVDHLVSHDLVVEYATQLAKRYFPKRSDNPVYLEPVINAFSYDLVLAPMHHRCHHLWRYNYDDLDILAQFYRFSNDKHGYYHLAQGAQERPTAPLFEEGCRLLGIRIGDSEELFSKYYVEGARARVAARVIETIAGLPFDHELNGHYGFLEQESTKRSRKLEGAGRFRFLRRGRTWMALGTSQMRERTIYDVNAATRSLATGSRYGIKRYRSQWPKACSPRRELIWWRSWNRNRPCPGE
jgi:hypothetical protein